MPPILSCLSVSLLSNLQLQVVLLQAEYFFEPPLILGHELGHLMVEVILNHEHLLVPVTLHNPVQPLVPLMHPLFYVVHHQQ